MTQIETIVSKFPQDILDKYDFTAAVYTGALNRITQCQCPTHGEFSQYAAQLRKGRGCPQCGNAKRTETRRMDPAQFISECQRNHAAKGYRYHNTKYVRMADKISVECPIHGEFIISALKHYYEGQGCKHCEVEHKKTRIKQFQHMSSAAKIANTGEHFFDDCREAHLGRYEYPEQEYKGAKTNITAICPKHGTFTQSAWKHLNGSGCPSCGQRSSQEQIIKEYLETLGVTVEQRNRKVIAPKEIDLWLPEYNIGIEYHGLHWHTEDRVGQLHLEKWKLANAAGIRIIQIFEDEWLNKQEIVKSRLCALVGKSEKVFARKTKIKSIEFRTAADFLSQTHIQSAGRAGISYGLYCGDVLVAVAVFGQARTGAMTQRNDGVWEVYRYASVGRVVGGFTKLYKHFIEDIQPTEVVSYCDLRYGNGGVYKAAGFVLDGISPPDYWWVASGKIERIPRYQMQKHKLQAHPLTKEYYVSGMTERQICEAAGLRRIYGVGNQKWVHKI